MPIDPIQCPVPIMNHKTIQLAHGAGGKLSNDLIETLFFPRFSNETLASLEDQAVLNFPGERLSFSTDSFVVDPIFFPGGNIGDLAIHGTVNDISMCGAEPLFLSVGFILEEGFPIEDLHTILLHMEEAAKEAGVTIVTGDTKVVHKGSCDKCFINTSGIGILKHSEPFSARRIAVGDSILLSGTIGDHGMAIMTSREGLSFQSRVQSDTAPLNGIIKSMMAASNHIHALRDPTRGGVATTLNEFAKTSQLGMKIDEHSIPVKDEVKGACEILGIDPLYVANEGKLVAIVDSKDTHTILDAMKAHPYGKDACIIGEVVHEHPGMVTLKTGLGVERIVDMPIGEQLPRIC